MRHPAQPVGSPQHPCPLVGALQPCAGVCGAGGVEGGKREDAHERPRCMRRGMKLR